MKTRFFLSLVAIMSGPMMFNSCTGFDGLQQKQENSNLVKFSSNILSVSRATDNDYSWEDDDKISIYMLRHDDVNKLKSITNDNKVLYSRKSSGTLSAEPSTKAFNYPTTYNVDFCAFYPEATVDEDGKIAVNILQNQTVEADQRASDILFTYQDNTTGYQKEDKVVELVLRHMLSKIVINCLTSPTTSKVTAIRINDTYITGTLNFRDANNRLTNGNITKPISARQIGTDQKFDAIIFPATYPTVNIEFTVDDIDKITTTISNKDFKSGECNVYNATVTRTGVSLSCRVDDWGTGTGGTLTAK